VGTFDTRELGRSYSFRRFLKCLRISVTGGWGQMPPQIFFLTKNNCLAIDFKKGTQKRGDESGGKEVYAFKDWSPPLSNLTAM
jgi:hypothetical protein